MSKEKAYAIFRAMSMAEVDHLIHPHVPRYATDSDAVYCRKVVNWMVATGFSHQVKEEKA